MKRLKFIISTIVCLIITNSLFSQTIIKLEKSGGVFYIPCKVNGKPLTFIFDTGASDVLLSLDEAKKLKDEGLLKKTDFLEETEKYQTASGEIMENEIVYIRVLEINDLVLNNIKASISSTANAPLLLGQSVLSKFGEFSFNYQNNTLTINSNTTADIKKKIEEAKKKASETGGNQSNGNPFNPIIDYEKILRQEKAKREVNISLDFDVFSITPNQSADGLILTFKYDITNNSEIDFSFVEHGFNYIYVDVVTEEGKTYSASFLFQEALSKKTVIGVPIGVNIRNNKPKFFRIYPMSKTW